MLFSLGDLITLAVVLVILIVFRAVDRQNRSLEKLKRFSDKIMENLSAFVEDRTTEVRRISGELAGGLKSGNELLKRTREVEDELSARAQDVEAMRKRFAEYDANLRELAATAAHVDQSLKRVREEAAFVEGVGRRLAEASGRLDAFEQRIGSMGEEFADANRASLAELRQQALAAVEERVRAIAAQLAGAEGTAKDVAAYVARLEQKASTLEQEKIAQLAKALGRFEVDLGDRLAAAGARAATLEDEAFEGLRKAVEAAEGRARSSFEELSRSITDRQADADYRLRRLEEAGADIVALEASLRDTVARAETGMRQQLETLSAELTAGWRAEVAAGEEERERLRTSIAELAGSVDELRSRALQDASEKLQVFEDGFFADLRTRSAAMQEKLQAWQAEVETRLASAGAGEAEARAELERRHTEDLRAALAELRTSSAEDVARIEAGIGALEQSVRERTAAAEAALAGLRETLKTEVDRTRRDAAAVFEKEIAGVRDAVDAASRRLHREIEGVATDAEAAIASLRDDFTAQKEQLAAASAAERDALRAEIGEYRAQLEEHRQKAEGLQQKLYARLDESHRALSAEIAETERRVKAFQGQTRLFERADTMRASLEADIEEMKKELARLGAEKAEVGELEAQLGRTRKAAEEVSGKLARFLAEKRRVDDMDGNFKRIIALSREVDLKLEGLGQTSDALQQIQAKVRQFEEMGRAVESGYERLEKKREVTEVTAQGVDRNFQRLETLEKTLAETSRVAEELGNRTQSLRGELENLAGRRQDAEAAREAVGKLEQIVVDLEGRLEKAQNAREWLARTETRFEEITRQAAEQVRLLESIVKAETRRDKGERGAPPLDKRDTVIKLAHQGWSVQEISRVTQLSRGEVELILELAPKA